MTNNAELVQQLVELYLRDPDEGEALAREYELWDLLFDTVFHPLQIKCCQEDVNAFIEYVLVDPETGEYVEQQDFHKEWQLLLAENDRMMIIAPRGHAKSYQIIGRAIWLLGHNPNLRIKIIAASDEKAKEILGLVRDFISDSDRVHEVFPNLQIDSKRGDRTTDFFVKRTIKQRDASVEASGVLSAGAGGRADVLICDDIVDLKNSVINPAMREQVIKSVQETWFSLVSATGRIIWICTPYHVADATHVLKATGVFKLWQVPAIQYTRHVDDEGNPVIDPETQQQKVTKQILWPSKWSEEKLMAKKAEVGERVFARQYLLNAMSDEERTFPEKALETSFDLSRADIGDDIDNSWVTFGGVDLAAALGKKNAWTVILTLALNPDDNRLYLKEMYRRRMPFPDTVRAVMSQARKHNWRLANVENNAYQQALIDAIGEQDKMIPIEPFTTGANKANEKVGLPGMAVAFEKGRFAIPAARFPLAPDDPSLISVLMNELRTHPGGEFSDIVMALWFAWSAATSGTGDFEDAWLEAQRTG
jgi:phage terminase large subunit-like protein